MLNFVKCFSHISWDNSESFLLYSLKVVYSIDFLLHIEPFCHSRSKFYLIMMYNYIQSILLFLRLFCFDFWNYSQITQTFHTSKCNSFLKFWNFIASISSNKLFDFLYLSCLSENESLSHSVISRNHSWKRHVYPNVHWSTVYNSRHGSNLDIHRHTNGKGFCGTYAQWNNTQL